MPLFAEWKDAPFSLTLTKILMVLLILGAVFLSANATLNNESLLIYMIVSAGLIFIIAQTEKEGVGEIINANFFGDNKGRMYLFLLVGLGLGSFLGMMARGGNLATVLPTQALYLGDWRFFLANLTAPLLESLFWRGIVFPTALAISLGIFKKTRPIAIIVALLVSGFIFGVYHVNVYFAQGQTFTNTYQIISIAALFGMLFVIGTSLTKTIALEVGWHFANNMFSEGYTTPEIFSTMALFVIGLVILTELSDRISRRR